MRRAPWLLHASSREPNVVYVEHLHHTTNTSNPVRRACRGRAARLPLLENRMRGTMRDRFVDAVSQLSTSTLSSDSSTL